MPKNNQHISTTLLIDYSFRYYVVIRIVRCFDVGIDVTVNTVDSVASGQPNEFTGTGKVIFRMSENGYGKSNAGEKLDNNTTHTHSNGSKFKYMQQMMEKKKRILS